MAEFALAGPTLTVRGALTAEDATDLRKWCLDAVLVDAKAVTVDMKLVPEIASLCMGVLATLWIDLAVAGRTCAIIPSPQVKRVMDLSGLSQVFLRSEKSDS